MTEDILWQTSIWPQPVDLAFLDLLRPVSIFYIQRENMREGYPMEDDDGIRHRPIRGPSLCPPTRRSILPHGRKVTLTVPSGQRRGSVRIMAMRRTSSENNGFPLEPTGDPMLDGIGVRQAWANRREDAPELDGHGHPKIVPMSKKERLLTTQPWHRPARDAGCGGRRFEVVGKITDMWIDEPEQTGPLSRDLDLDAKVGVEGKRLVPLTLARIWGGKVKINSIYGKHFATVPTIASAHTGNQARGRKDLGLLRRRSPLRRRLPSGSADLRCSGGPAA